MTGQMLNFLGFGSTLILYGLLSERPAGGIDTIGFIGKSQTIESFLLSNVLAKKSLLEYLETIMKVEPMYHAELTTVV